jgi:hypothetical protein
MINPLALQETNRPIVVSLVNKKTGQAYSVPQDKYSQSNSFEMHTPSISLSKGFQINTHHNTVQTSAKSDTSSNSAGTTAPTSPTAPASFPLPGRDFLCILYILFTALTGIISLTIPYFQRDAFVIFMPIVCITIFMHMLTTPPESQGAATLGLGLLTILLYPFAIVFTQYHFDSVVAACFILFCSWPTLTGKYGYLKLAMCAFLVTCCTIGIVVYQVYPKSIHGMHAAFMSMCILACCSLFFMPPMRFSLVATAVTKSSPDGKIMSNTNILSLQRLTGSNKV